MGNLKITTDEFNSLLKMYNSSDMNDLRTAGEIINRLDFKNNIGEILLFSFIIENKHEVDSNVLLSKQYKKAKKYLEAQDIVPVTMNSYTVDIMNYIVASKVCSEKVKEYVFKYVNGLMNLVFSTSGFSNSFKLSITINNEFQ
jgi:hypothetical protein